MINDFIITFSYIFGFKGNVATNYRHDKKSGRNKLVEIVKSQESILTNSATFCWRIVLPKSTTPGRFLLGFN